MLWTRFFPVFSPWPEKPQERDVLYFLAQSLRARLVKELPPERGKLGSDSQTLVLQAKDRITELANISLEIARMAVTPEDGKELPDWFVVELFPRPPPGWRTSGTDERETEKGTTEDQSGSGGLWGRMRHGEAKSGAGGAAGAGDRPL